MIADREKIFCAVANFFQVSLVFNLSLSLVGVWYIMWSNIGNVIEHKNAMEFLPSPRRSFDSGPGNPNNQALQIHADCHSSVKGIFLGMLTT